MSDPHSMPDVSQLDERHQYAPLDWVGMNGIHLPTKLVDSLQGECLVSTTIQAYVNLQNPASRGIHMSRLYLQLDQNLANKPLTADSLKTLLTGFVSSHEGLSTRAFVELAFDFSLRRKALKSSNSGWKAYPAAIRAELVDGSISLELAVKVPYSSTCPASAALARQLIQQAFSDKFGANGTLSVEQALNFLGTTDGIVATPHSQRSIAQIKVKLDANHTQALPLTHLIDQIEGVLKTAVQTAVKREDEQEFARLNGQNLLFCEDASRRIKGLLDSDASYLDYWVRVNHLESLHAHDAVAVVTKQIKNGYQPIPGPGISQ